MLKTLGIRNIAVVEKLEINFEDGFNVLTGETGAGKSILLQALHLVLGERAPSNIVRTNHKTAEIFAIFEIQNLPSVQAWLEEQDLGSHSECFIRRTMTQDNRTRAYINDVPVSLQCLRGLSQQLIYIHGQHHNQQLLSLDHQRHLLDAYGHHTALLKKLKSQYEAYQQTLDTLTQLKQSKHESEKQALLDYQIAELETLDLKASELADLDKKHQQLSHAETTLTLLKQAQSILQDHPDHNLQSNLTKILSELSTLKHRHPEIKNALSMLDQALIHITEATDELRVIQTQCDVNPNHLNQIESRLSQIYDLARKHHVSPQTLPAHYQKLILEKNQFTDQKAMLLKLEKTLEKNQLDYLKLSEKLSQKRRTQARKLATHLLEKLKYLDLEKARVEIRVERELTRMSPVGQDKIEIFISPNQGQPLLALQKTASGGELARISLALQTISAEKIQTPTLIFDEIDVGMSGKIASKMGQFMQNIAQQTQIFCITHLPQTASFGKAHFKISKKQRQNETRSQIKKLTPTETTTEIARMLGGAKITPQALENAKNLQAEVSQPEGCD